MNEVDWDFLVILLLFTPAVFIAPEIKKFEKPEESVMINGVRNHSSKLEKIREENDYG